MDRKIPYFLTWAVEKAQEARTNSTKVARADDDHISLQNPACSPERCRESLCDQTLIARILKDTVNIWKDTYAQVRVYQKAPQISSRDLEFTAKAVAILVTIKTDSQHITEAPDDAANEAISLLMEQFFQTSMQALEVFTPKDFVSPVVQKSDGAISSILEVSYSIRNVWPRYRRSTAYR
jgi:hypothetical protein